jgi:hypothetical protein
VSKVESWGLPPTWKPTKVILPHWNTDRFLEWDLIGKKQKKEMIPNVDWTCGSCGKDNSSPVMTVKAILDIKCKPCGESIQATFTTLAGMLGGGKSGPQA